MKTMHLPLLAICLLATTFLYSQTTSNIQQSTSINTDGSAPNVSSILDVQSTTQGMLVPRMTTAQRTAIAAGSPATGLLVFDTDKGGFWFYGGSTWVNLSTPNELADADDDTKIQVEESPDEDIIRFDVAGVEQAVIDATGFKWNAPYNFATLPSAGTYHGMFAHAHDLGRAYFSHAGNWVALAEAAKLFDTEGDTKIQVEESPDEDIIRFDVAGNELAIIDATGFKWNAPYNFATLPSAGTYHGMFAHAHDLGRAYFSHAGNWVALAEAAKLFDTNGNTTIQLEESPDEDIIRMDLAGSERLVIRKNNAGLRTMLELPNNLSNTFFGSNAGANNSSGSTNTFMGNNAGLNNTGGNTNVFVGGDAGGSNTTGNSNTSIGYEAGEGNMTGSGNVFLGHMAGKFETGGNKLYIDNTGANTPLIYGDFTSNFIGINRVPTTNTLEVGGNASKASAGDWLANSDARLKTNIEPLKSEEMLQRLLMLEGITYEWDDDKTGNQRPVGLHYGFTAQNIQEVFPTLVEEDALGYLQTAYGTYDAMTVEALRALNNKIENLETENASLKNRLARLETVVLQKAGSGTKTERVGEE